MEYFETKLFDISDAAGVDNEHVAGYFEGLCSTSDLDRVGDIVEPTAFRDTKAADVRLLWQHRQTEPIGVIEDMQIQAKGVRIRAAIANTTQGRDVMTLLRLGAIRCTSIGYTVPQGGSRIEQIKGADGKPQRVRRINRLVCHEVSIVSVPANPAAIITQVKSEAGDYASPVEFERALRELGLSKTDAKCVVSKGYKHLLLERGESPLGSAHDEVEQKFRADIDEIAEIVRSVY